MTGHYKFLLHGLCTSAIVCILSVGSCLAQWTTLPGFAGGISWNASAYLDGKLYSFGGVSSGQPLNTARSMDVSGSGGWTLIKSLPSARYGAYAATVNGKIYIIGGQSSSSTYQTTVLEYNPATDSYAIKASMPVPASRFGGAVIGSRIYVIGGMTSSSAITRSVYSYDAASDTWSYGESIPDGMIDPTATAIESTIYLIGGQTSSNFLAHAYRGILSGTTITWSPIADYPVPVTRAGSGELKGKLYVAGGVGNSNYVLTSTYIYDDAGDKWLRSYPMPLGTYDEPSLPGDGSSLYYLGGYQNSNIFKLTVDKPVAVAVVSRTDFLVGVLKGEQKASGTSIRNDGIVPLTITVEIPTDAQPWLSTDASPASIQPGDSLTIGLTASAAKTNAGDYRATVVLHTNDSSRRSIPIDVRLYVREMLTHQATKVVLEGGSATWCGWCPYGDDSLAAITSRYPDNAIVIAYHGPVTQDSLAIPEGNAILSSLGLNAWPEAAIQRRKFPGESVPMIDRGLWSQRVVDVLREQPYAPVAIQLDRYSYNMATKILSAHLRMSVTDPLRFDSSHTYRITAVVTQDSINSHQVLCQSNGSCGIVLYPYYHNNVARTIWPGANGQELIIPGNAVSDGVLLPGMMLDQDISFTVENVGDPRLSHVVFIVHEFNNGKLGEILQGYEIPLAGRLLVTTEQFARTIGLHDTASFRSIVRNIGNTPSQLTLARTENVLPEEAWKSWFCVNGYCYHPDQDTAFVFVLAPGDSAVVDLHVFGASAGVGKVTLHVANNDEEWSDRTFTITTLSTSIVNGNMATTGGLSLARNLPNPASGRTRFTYLMPTSGSSSLDLFTLTGEKVLSSAIGYQEPGEHGVAVDVSALPMGIYVARLSAAGASVSRLITVMR